MLPAKLHIYYQCYLLSIFPTAKTKFSFYLPLYLQRQVVTCRITVKSIHIHHQPPEGSISASWPPRPGLHPPNYPFTAAICLSSMVIYITMHISTHSRTQRKSGKTPERNVIFYATCSSSFSTNFARDLFL